MSDSEERIRARAHAIWESEGRPEGRAVEHWQKAVEDHEFSDVTADELTETTTNALTAPESPPYITHKKKKG